jgi:hypothetical protein
MKHFWDESELEEIVSPEARKTLATPAVNFLVSDIKNRLQLCTTSRRIIIGTINRS